MKVLEFPDADKENEGAIRSMLLDIADDAADYDQIAIVTVSHEGRVGVATVGAAVTLVGALTCAATAISTLSD